MKTPESNKNLIAKWINDDLDPIEKAEFEKTDEFFTYQKILMASDRLTPPPSDMEKMETILFDTIASREQLKPEPNSEDLIAKWINDDLEPKQKAEFEKTNDFFIYNKILTASDRLAPPPSDLQKIEKNLFEKIDSKEQLNPKKTKTFRLQYWSYGVAAAALLVLGFFFFSNTNQEYTTGYSEQLAIDLPDGSNAILTPKSTLSFNGKNWKSNRLIHLDGEAFFDVEKGSSFEVKTNKGKVTVLGTQFKVRTTEKMFEVVCLEGKVKVEAKDGKNTQLTRGKGYRILNDQEFKWDIDENDLQWSENETVCHYLTMSEVLTLLEDQFNIQFKNVDVDLNQHFTGAYNNKDPSLALKTIFTPMKIDYEIQGKNVVIIRNRPH